MLVRQSLRGSWGRDESVSGVVKFCEREEADGGGSSCCGESFVDSECCESGVLSRWFDFKWFSCSSTALSSCSSTFSFVGSLILSFIGDFVCSVVSDSSTSSIVPLTNSVELPFNRVCRVLFLNESVRVRFRGVLLAVVEEALVVDSSSSSVCSPMLLVSIPLPLIGSSDVWLRRVLRLFLGVSLVATEHMMIWWSKRCKLWKSQ